MAALVSGVVTAGLPAGAMGGWVEAGAANLASLNPSDVHILLVDDEQLSRMVVTNLLRKCGYKVTSAENGAQAMEVLKAAVPNTFHLVLTDLMMPEVDGLHLLRFVRSHEWLRNLPVVMMSAINQKDTVFECIKGGAEEFLVKPVTQKEVQNIWTHVWRRLSSFSRLEDALPGAADDSRRPTPESSMTSADRVPRGPSRLSAAAFAGEPDAVQRAAPPAAAAAAPPAPIVQPALAPVLGVLPAIAAPATAVAAPARAVRFQLGHAPAAAAAGSAPPRHQQHSPSPSSEAARSGPPATTARSQQGATAATTTTTATAPGGSSRSGHHHHHRSASSARAHRVSLHDWLTRPGRAVDPQESLWLFCETMLMVEGRAAAGGGGSNAAAGAASRFCPSRLILHSSGRISLRHGGAGGSAPRSRSSKRQLSPQGQQQQQQQQQAGDGEPQPEAVAAPARGAGELSAAVAAAAAGAAAAVDAVAEQGADGGATADADAAAADRLYVSPEEEQGSEAVSAEPADVFRLGMLFFELCYVAPPGQRAAMLAALRERQLPRELAAGHPQEAAFILSLLTADPAARPSLSDLLAMQPFQAVCASLRERHARQLMRRRAGAAAAEAAAAAKQAAADQSEQHVLGDFLRMMRQHKLTEVRDAQRQLSLLACDIAQVVAHLESDAPVAPAAVAPPAGPEGELPAAKRQQLQGACDGGTPAAAPAAASAAARAPGASGYKLQRISNFYSQLEQAFFQRRAGSAAAAAADGGGGGAAEGGGSGGSGAPLGRSISDLLDGTRRASALAAAGAMAAAATSPPLPPPQPQPPPLPSHLASFSDDLCRFVKYERAVPLASLRYGDQLSSSNMVCSIAFDRDEEYFATAGVSKRIKIFEYARVVPGGAAGGGASAGGVCAPAGLLAPGCSGHHLGSGGGGLLGAGCSSSGASAAALLHHQHHYPLLEISSRSRLSNVCWSGYVKHQLASSDYEGVVQLWDVNANTSLMTFEEHAKRVWCVDFCRADPTRLLSGSDDGTARLWAINQEQSVATIDLRANVCSVQFGPDSSHLVALGCANYRAYLFDLRNTAQPLAVLPAHSRAVSYVRFLSPGQLVTASTDNTLKLWDIGRAMQAASEPSGAEAAAAAACDMTYRGHANERNFVGLAVGPDGHIACGSENNAVYVYYKAVPVPVLAHPLPRGADGLDPLDGLDGLCGGGGSGGGLHHHHQGGAGGGGGQPFVSSVCWSGRNNVLLAANSLGVIRVLGLA